MEQPIDAHVRLGKERSPCAAVVEDVLRSMDGAGIARSWICPDDASCAVHNREGNDFTLHAVREHPDRFIGCAVANPWFGTRAVEELRRSFENGLRVLFLCPPVQGFQISDPLIDPLIEEAERFKAPVYCHTGTPVCAEPFQLAALARRHPDARLIMGHMGYADFWYDAIPAAEMADNLWLETSLIDGDLIAEGVRTLGAGRFLFGSGAPVSVVGLELEKILSLPLPRAEIERITHLNAKGLLP